MNRDNSQTASITFIDLLTLMLIGLKLAGVIPWTWLMVFTPLLIGLGLVVVLAIIAAVLE